MLCSKKRIPHRFYWSRRDKRILKLADGLNRNNIPILNRFNNDFFNKISKIFGEFPSKEMFNEETQINLPFMCHKKNLPFINNKEHTMVLLIHNKYIITNVLNLLEKRQLSGILVGPNWLTTCTELLYFKKFCSDWLKFDFNKCLDCVNFPDEFVIPKYQGFICRFCCSTTQPD